MKDSAGSPCPRPITTRLETEYYEMAADPIFVVVEPRSASLPRHVPPAASAPSFKLTTLTRRRRHHWPISSDEPCRKLLSWPTPGPSAV